MRTCYLHLGMPKTGSTSIQDCFFNFENDTMIYAKAKWSNHAIFVTAPFRKEPRKLKFLRGRSVPVSDEFVKRHVSEMRKTLKNSISGNKDVILSGEAIVDELFDEEIGDLIAYLKTNFDRIQVIAYIRPLASLAPSQLQQRIKSGPMKFRLPDPDYRKRFEAVLKYAGAANITFIRFDRKDLIGGDVVFDFASRVGLQAPPTQIEPSNESFSAEIIATLYKSNRMLAKTMSQKEILKLNRKFLRTFPDAGNIKFGLSETIMSNHLKTHAQDVLWMENACGFDVKGSIKTVERPIESEKDLLSLALPLNIKNYGGTKRASFIMRVLSKVKDKVW